MSSRSCARRADPSHDRIGRARPGPQRRGGSPGKARNGDFDADRARRRARRRGGRQGRHRHGPAAGGVAVAGRDPRPPACDRGYPDPDPRDQRLAGLAVSRRPPRRRARLPATVPRGRCDRGRDRHLGARRAARTQPDARPGPDPDRLRRAAPRPSACRRGARARPPPVATRRPRRGRAAGRHRHLGADRRDLHPRDGPRALRACLRGLGDVPRLRAGADPGGGDRGDLRARLAGAGPVRAVAGRSCSCPSASCWDEGSAARRSTG